ncbi:MAG: efflux RND transporter permease subunit [Candidatus Fonsibacter sp.]|nr:efflux RND transporter permease subunit [Candidatus Fonsibacter sp.]
MFLTDISIKRPVFATVMSIILIIFGLVIFNKIAVRELPDIDPSIVTVRTVYKGASAEIVDSQITQKIEDIVGGTPGLATIDSRSEDGRSVVKMEFEPGVSVDEATNDIRDRVSRIIDNLPDNASRPEIFKTSEGNQVAIWLRLRSKNLNDLDLSDYASRYLKDYFSSVDGVGQIILSGEKEISLRVWINPSALSARDLTVSDIESVLLKENIELPAGRLESKSIDLNIKVDKNYKNVEDFKNLPIKRARDGSLVRLKDVARVELGPLNLRTLFKGNGDPVVGIGIYQQSNSNTIAVVDGIKKKLTEVKKNLPEGIQLDVAFDRSNYIRVAVNEVYITLFISVALVVAVIYLFLGNLTSVIIPALAIPVSLISTFLLIYAANFSLNLFTLMALVIAIGLVVDDAIVMLENIYRRVEGGESPLIASYKGASQVSFAIIATTVVLIAVFVPLVFVKGIVGKLFTELALTLSFSIVISAFVALTLSPMLASKYLKVSHSKPNFLKKFDSYLDKFSNFYFETLLLLLYKKKEIIIFLVGVLVSVIILFKITPKELIPPEDRGVFYVVIQAPDGSGFEYTKEKVENIEKIFLADLGKGLYREILVRVPGFQSGIDQVNTGFLIVLLENWGKRKKFSNENLGGIFQQLNSFPGVKAFPIMPQGLRGGAGEKPVQFVLKGNTYEELIKWKEILKTEIVKNKNLVNVDDDLDLTKPQLKIKINADKAADLGVSVDSIAKTIETMFGSKEVTKYTKDGREYSVMLQADVKNRREPSNLNKVVVRSSSGKLVPLTSVATFYEESTYTSLNRYNRQRAVTISARLVGGYTISEALNYLEGITKEKLPANARVDYKGESLEFKNTSSDIYFIFILALFTAYLSLAAQFESWRHPLTIMLTVPLAILGGIIGLWVIGSSLNIYSQIALIVLIGLAAKNGILIVEFANQLRTQGLQLKEAIIESCRVRLRPILMTSVATIIGVVPLIIATGPGAASRATVGIVIFMGMLFATLFTLYVIPVMYLIIGKNTGRMDAVEIELEKQLKEASSK